MAGRDLRKVQMDFHAEEVPVPRAARTAERVQ